MYVVVDRDCASARDQHGFVAHRAVDTTIQAAVDRYQFVADESHRAVQIPFRFALPAQQPGDEVVGVAVRIVLDVIDLIENAHRPLGIGLQSRPVPLEDPVQSFVGTQFLAR